MLPLRLALVVLVSCAGGASAQPGSGHAQPDRLAFGNLHVGARVEASVMVLQPGDDTHINFEVKAPKFVQVIHKSMDTQEYGRGNSFVRGSVEITLDTSAAGKRQGDIAITLGQQTVRLPVRATVKPRRAALLRVLIVGTPFERFSTQHGQRFDAWTRLVNDAAWDVSYLLARRGKEVMQGCDLASFDSILLGPEGVFALTPADVRRVRAFAEAGGRVVVAANYFYRGTVAKANIVLKGYGLALRDTEAGFGQNRITLGKDDLDPQLVKTGITTVHFFRASPASLTAGRNGRVLAKALGVGERGDGFVAMARAGKGEVIALGNSLWCFWITPEYDPSGGNTKLLRWVLASGHHRQQRLASHVQPLPSAQRERFWLALASTDPDETEEAMGTLESAPAVIQQTVLFLRGHLKAAPPPNLQRLRPLIAALDNPRFAVREKGQSELQRMGEDAVPLLRKALEDHPSPEVRRRLEAILKTPRTLSPENLQGIRAVEVLETIGTPDARQVLKSLAQGAPGAILTKEAKAALERLPRTRPGR